MLRSTVLVVIYACLAALWQMALWSALPNVGMGGIAVTYIIWPFLAVSAIGLWFGLRSTDKGKLPIFASALVAMLVGTLLIHPQDSRTDGAAKLDALVGLLPG